MAPLNLLSVTYGLGLITTEKAQKHRLPHLYSARYQLSNFVIKIGSTHPFHTYLILKLKLLTKLTCVVVPYRSEAALSQ